MMMASAQVVETSVNTNNSPSQDYTSHYKPGRSLKPQHWLTWVHAPFTVIRIQCFWTILFFREPLDYEFRFSPALVWQRVHVFRAVWSILPTLPKPPPTPPPPTYTYTRTHTHTRTQFSSSAFIFVFALRVFGRRTFRLILHKHRWGEDQEWAKKL